MAIIADLPIGAKIKFGTYSVNGEEVHRIRWIKTHRDQTFLSEYLEDQCAFDAKEPNNRNDYRRRYGNNCYSLSNVNQFLCSDKDDWYVPQHEYDEAPTDEMLYGGEDGYRGKPGFLRHFEQWELEAIETSEIKTALPNNDVDEEKFEIIHAKVFLPSRTNLTGKEENGVKEGEFWDYFACGASLKARLSPECFEYGDRTEKPNYQDESWYYNLRSPYSGDAFNVRYVDRGGFVGYCYACDGVLGVRPALRLNPEILISDEPDDDGYYEVLDAAQEIAEITEEDFFAIL